MPIKKHSWIIFLIISIFLSYSLSSNIFFVRSSVINTVIEIDGNQMLRDYCSEGTGEASDPLYIRGKDFSSNVSGFIIKNTDLHLIIFNCYISGNGESNYTTGIKLVNCENIGIVNSIIENYGNGISIVNSSNIEIAHSIIISNLLNGIYAINSDSVRIISSEIGVNEKSGIKLFQSDNWQIWSNLVHFNNEDGISLEYSNNNEIKGSDKISENQRYGIYLFKSNYNIIQGNILSENEIQCIYSLDCTDNTIESNSYFCDTVYETTEIINIPENKESEIPFNIIIVAISIGLPLGIFLRFRRKIKRFLKAGFKLI